MSENYLHYSPYMVIVSNNRMTIGGNTVFLYRMTGDYEIGLKRFLE